jgi:hypothetical protein
MLQTVFAANSLRVAFSSAVPAVAQLSRLLQRSCATYRCTPYPVNHSGSSLSVLFEPGFNTALPVGPEPEQNEQLLRYASIVSTRALLSMAFEIDPCSYSDSASGRK